MDLIGTQLRQIEQELKEQLNLGAEASKRDNEESALNDFFSVHSYQVSLSDIEH